VTFIKNGLLVENPQLEIGVKETVDLRVDPSAFAVVKVGEAVAVVVPGERVVRKGDIGRVGRVGFRVSGF
jgi:hypothetical protein